MSKKLLLSILVIVVAIGLVGVGTYAMWSDSATSAGNEFKTGNLDVTVSGGPITVSNMYPGSSANYTFAATNAGSIAGSSLVMTGAFADVAPGTLSSELKITGLTVDGVAFPMGAPLAISSLGSIDLGALGSGATKTVVITITMDSDATANMNESVTGGVTFTLNQ